MERHILDTDERIFSLIDVLTTQLLERLVDGKLDFNVEHERCLGLAESIDEIASRKYTGDDLEEYSARMKACVSGLGMLKSNVDLESQGKNPNYSEFLGSLAYLMAELISLQKTVKYVGGVTV